MLQTLDTQVPGNTLMLRGFPAFYQQGCSYCWITLLKELQEVT
jgi:hypothetical protein